MSADQYNVGGDWVTATITPAGESEGGGFNVHLWFPPGRVDELTAARAIEAMLEVLDVDSFATVRIWRAWQGEVSATDLSKLKG